MISLHDALSKPADPAIDDLASADLSLPDSDTIVKHPDGYYWVAPDGHQEFGPFVSAAEAMADMNDAADEALEPCETLAEAERELGLSDWLDPDTGQLAEDMGGRFEDH